MGREAPVRRFLRLVLFVLATFVAVLALRGGLRAMEATAPPPDDPKLLANRVWAERAPRDDRDLVLYFVPVQVGSKRVGVFERNSRYAMAAELFRWSRDGGTLKLELPQRQQTAKLGVRTWACKDAPKGFDLCLELTTGDDKLRLYSRSGWRFDAPSRDTLGESDLAGLAPGIAALAGVAAETDLGPAGCDGCTEIGLDALR
jgi:hypothetical protein